MFLFVYGGWGSHPQLKNYPKINGMSGRDALHKTTDGAGSLKVVSAPAPLPSTTRRQEREREREKDEEREKKQIRAMKFIVSFPSGPHTQHARASSRSITSGRFCHRQSQSARSTRRIFFNVIFGCFSVITF